MDAQQTPLHVHTRKLPAVLSVGVQFLVLRMQTNLNRPLIWDIAKSDLP